MTRRAFLISCLGGSGLVLTAGIFQNLPSKELKGRLSIDAVLKLCDSFKANPLAIETTGVWSANQIFAHCAQSIELSFSGFPVHKGELFKAVLGKTAFGFFAARGKLTHNLSEQIPGLDKVPSSNKASTIKDSIERLTSAFKKLGAASENLQEHFAYGPLSVRQHNMAHILHFYNHLDEINFA